MLSNDEYTGYEKGVPNRNNIFSAANEVKFKEYEKAVGFLKIKKTIKILVNNIEEAKTNEEKEKAIQELKEYGYGI